MRILYVALKNDYGDPARGLSYEQFNFFDSLLKMGHELLQFDFMATLRERGRDAMNRRLEEIVRAEKPDLLFMVLFKDEFEPETLRRISDSGSCVTLNWFCDDHWRFNSFSRRYAPCFHWVTTTAQGALSRYAGIGVKNVIKTQWACNPFLYRKLDLPLKYDLSFVGQPHGARKQIIDFLGKNGLKVHAFGHGWEAGRVGQEQMIEIFNQSRINLNFTHSVSEEPLAGASAASGPSLLARARGLGSRALSKALRELPYGAEIQARRVAREALRPHRLAQIKGRNFEVPGCGGFLLTGPAENLPEYYEPGKEIAIFQSADDFLAQIREYLKSEDKRAALAEAGYRKTLEAHTYPHRFREIFARLGWTEESFVAPGEGKGSVQELS